MISIGPSHVATGGISMPLRDAYAVLLRATSPVRLRGIAFPCRTPCWAATRPSASLLPFIYLWSLLFAGLRATAGRYPRPGRSAAVRCPEG
ncbi:hypothetical protein BO70DRAFT_80380 [Aspergillus heteromorphus CBS 117.55]|uniref:Uncharacterized protein n=1 Tax=Aspergillus heteromorphus CBS 117.55 TaxID=1448321 RepID=A0A317WZV9_9EURO|nr:uncharacterized protein BO70DRAFT_80380 [Aspergillus heteromorphus CBS 117.55]PWY90862.1 hypothetical protein BO70DRAFT_80380 [Aspergillus heteromorphus CBS 117.55]